MRQANLRKKEKRKEKGVRALLGISSKVGIGDHAGIVS
jgi:hypothetical protein